MPRACPSQDRLIRAEGAAVKILRCHGALLSGVAAFRWLRATGGPVFGLDPVKPFPVFNHQDPLGARYALR